MDLKNLIVVAGFAVGAGGLAQAKDTQSEPVQSSATNSSPSKNMIVELGLPVGKSASYYNRATNTAFRENCKEISDTVVSCRLQVQNLNALLNFTTNNEYSVDATGKISVKSSLESTTPWTQSTSMHEYGQNKSNAQITNWMATSPLARLGQNSERSVIQNDVGELSEKNGNLTVRSSVPINERRGLEISTSFDKASGKVQSVVMPRVAIAGAVVDAEAKASYAMRNFDYKNDTPYFDQYKAKLETASIFKRQ